ncbi:4-hydroxyphenylacetate 3-hydroxylase [Actinomadura sp. KC345]|uniref:4-hydroxyphenylacetate 3-hydroxylase N-terminal domain-containing protein n=1 Tax=Actinomadura sp. KC345 TaxID=2530371 RepID=UPI0010540AF4|nr:4-hydroxyphenylacetate 3-hydroxylase N-terminal domain-containing protein [Actinomadura sp. KC345]TDC44791.1 4-hydroxyphenylacetate 3-hydroxylase [Actinomadura sp. KC345]
MLTGRQYKDSLKDGRRVYFEGRLIEDLESEPALAAPLQAIADGYDKYYSAEPGAVNPVTLAPRSQQELRDRIPVITEMDLLLNVTYQSLMTLLVAAGRLEDGAPEFVPRIKAYVEDARLRDIRITECITDAKGNRSLAPAKQDDPDAYVRVVERRQDGVVIRGAKLHISAAAFGHDLMVMPTKSMKPGEEDYSIACAVPVNAPGVHITNTTYHPRGGDMRDYPVSAKESIPDSMVIFDDVFVPHERVFLDGQTEHAAVFAHSLGLWERLGGVSFMVIQADELVGLAHLIAESNGTSRVSHVREKIDEMMIHATLLRAGLEAALTNAHATPDGFYYPDDMYTNVTKYQGAANFSTMVRHLHDIAGGAVVTAPSMSDFDNPELRPLLEKYMGTGPGVPGEYRTKLFHAIRDTTADSYGGWHHVTNLQSGGGLFAQRLVTRKNYDIERARALGLKAAGLSGA